MIRGDQGDTLVVQFPVELSMGNPRLRLGVEKYGEDRP